MANRSYRVLIAAAVVALLTACQSSTTGTAQVSAGVPQTPPAAETSTSDTAATDTISTGTDSTRAPGGQPASSTTTSTPASSAPTSAPSFSTAVTPTASPTTSSPPPGSDDTFPDCVYGDWIASNEWFASAVAQLSGGAAHYISGDVLVTFKPDGTAQTHYRKWTNEFVVEDVTITVVRDGKDTANYTVEEDGSFAMQDVKLSSELTMTGHSPQGTVIMGNPHPEPASATGTFLCIDKLLYVQTGDGEMVLGRPGLVDGS